MKYLVLVLLFVAIGTAYSQKDSTISNVYKLSLKDGSTIIGELIKQDTSGLKFKTLSGIIVIIPKDKISSIEIIDKDAIDKIDKIDKVVIEEKTVEDEEYFEDPSSSRLFLFPTAKPMKSGDVSFSIYELYFPNLSIGIQDIVTLSVGMSIIPNFENQIIYLAPKITPYQSENFSVAIGGIYLKPIQERSSESFGLFYGLGTYGNKKTSFTAGITFGYSSEEIFNDPLIIIGGDIIFSENLKIITENWINVKGEGSIVSLGFRFFTKKLSADLGFARYTDFDEDGFPFIPWVGFSYYF